MERASLFLARTSEKYRKEDRKQKVKDRRIEKPQRKLEGRGVETHALAL
jgi:hypothetical protein